MTEFKDRPMRDMIANVDQRSEDAAYLRELAEKLMHVPVFYGVDGHDIFMLNEIAGRL